MDNRHQRNGKPAKPLKTGLYKMISYTQLVDIYTGLKMSNINVLSFNSDDNHIIINKTTSSEILAISATLKATGFKNEVVMFETLSFKIRFI